MKRVFKGILIVFLILIIICIAVVYWFYTDYQDFIQKPLNIPLQHQTYTINKGMGLQSLASDLVEKEIISSQQKWMVQYFSRLSKQTINLKAGRYQLPKKLTLTELFTIFSQGKTIHYKLTLIEGSTLKEILALIAKSKNLKHQLTLNKPLAEQLKLDQEHFEGWFFPDTYYFEDNTSDIQFLKRTYRKMQQVLNQEWQNRADDLPFKTPYEALIMASIIEKESAVKHERAIIAGVFIKRLQLGMRLQTDPTVIYGMGENFDGNLRRKDLRRDTPYNTYTRKGLPPTPICMVGREAIHAALHPKIDGSLYFVAKGQTGEHYFSKTLKEHNRAVRKYQLNR